MRKTNNEEVNVSVINKNSFEQNFVEIFNEVKENDPFIVPPEGEYTDPEKITKIFLFFMYYQNMLDYDGVPKDLFKKFASFKNERFLFYDEMSNISTRIVLLTQDYERTAKEVIAQNIDYFNKFCRDNKLNCKDIIGIDIDFYMLLKDYFFENFTLETEQIFVDFIGLKLQEYKNEYAKKTNRTAEDTADKKFLDKLIENFIKLKITIETFIQQARAGELVVNEMSGNLSAKLKTFIKEYSPVKIKEYLDRKVIGQDEAKKTFAVTIYNHFVSLVNPDLNLKKNNLLMVGPSGCGKTEMLRVFSEISPVPISFFDCSGVSQDGWSGSKKPKDCLPGLYRKSNRNLELMANGIIFLDEFDKLCKPSHTSHGENVSEALQGDFLALIEGATVEFRPNKEEVPVFLDTSNILFICAGAFAGIEKSILAVKNANAAIGFNGQANVKDAEYCSEDVSKEVLIKFGVMPELAGRLATSAVLKKLTKEDLYRIITECEGNVLEDFKKLAKAGYDIEVDITKEAIQEIVDKTEEKTGARDLRSQVGNVFNDLFFKVSSGEITYKKILIDKGRTFTEKKTQRKRKTTK